MAKRIAVIYGGPSSEASVSKKSASAVAAALRRLGHEVLMAEYSPSLPKELEKFGPDLAFPVLHGKPGEDGTVQGLLEVMGIPYVGEGVKTSALCMDKDFTKRILVSFGLPTPRWVAVKEENLSDLEDWNSLPAVVKPAEEGSSIGLEIVENPSLLEGGVRKLLQKVEKVLVEEFIDGRELTCGFVKGRVLPPLEIKPKKGIYDFEAKYTVGETEFFPVEDEDLKRRVQSLTAEVVKALEIKDLCRVDFRISNEGRAYVLEVNTIPGMTETSLLPKMAALEGLDFDRLIDLLIS